MIFLCKTPLQQGSFISLSEANLPPWRLNLNGGERNLDLNLNLNAETLADPYKGKTPLPRVPNYREPFASRHVIQQKSPNT